VPPTRVVVFIDYQNVRYTARGLFWPEDPPPPRTAGHVDPVRFAELLCALGRDRDPTRVLAGVRVYRGQPVAGSERAEPGHRFQGCGRGFAAREDHETCGLQEVSQVGLCSRQQAAVLFV